MPDSILTSDKSRLASSKRRQGLPITLFAAIKGRYKSCSSFSAADVNPGCYLVGPSTKEANLQREAQ